MTLKKKWLWNPLQLLPSKLYYVSLQDPSQPLKPILALSSRNGIYMMEFDSLQTARKLNPPMALKKKWLWNPRNYCPPNCSKFPFEIRISHSNQSQPYPQEMVLTCWSLICFKLPQNSSHQWLSRRNGCGTPFNYCPPNCTYFLFKIRLSHSNESQPCPQEMVFT